MSAPLQRACHRRARSGARAESLARRALLAALALLAPLAVLEPLAARAANDVLLLHGHIYTGDPKHPWAEALAVRDGHIAAVGSDATAAKGRRDLPVIDLHGRTVIPGIVDSHLHMLFGAYALLSLPFLTIHVALAGIADIFVAIAYGLAAIAMWQWARTREPSDAGLAILMAIVCASVKLEGSLWVLTLVPGV